MKTPINGINFKSNFPAFINILYPKTQNTTQMPSSLSLPRNLTHQILTLITECQTLNHVKQLQGHLTTLGHAQTHLYAFKLIRFCTLTLSNLTYAHSIFNSLNAPNIYLYTAMITAYASTSHQQREAVFELYCDMVRTREVLPNHYVYPHVLKCCEGFTTKMVHTQIEKFGFGEYSVVGTALVDSYGKWGGGVWDARKVFDGMSERSVVSWTAMVTGYLRCGEFESALSVFEEMPETERDVPSWNAFIGGCAQSGMFMEAVSVFRRMVREDHGFGFRFRPNQVTVVCVLSACGHTGMLQFGRDIHGYVYKSDLYGNKFIMNALVDMYGKCGSLGIARRVFDRTPGRSLISWNSMINSYALHGRYEEAISVFEEMKHKDVMPDKVTFVALLNACTHGGLVERGREYFGLMTNDYGIEPQIQHYGCLIDLLGRAGRFEEALKVLKNMNIEPDEVVWGSLLNGCRIHNRADLAEFAVKKLIEIDPSNGGYGTMLANLYGKLGKWEEAHRVRKTLQDQKAHKTPGCSWIEVDNQVHQFYSVDTSHPSAEEIYKILDTLVGFY